MRFSICYALIAKRGFFVYQNFFTYDASVGDYLGRWFGCGPMSMRFFKLWFETHATRVDTTLSFREYGLNRSMEFGYLLINWYTPHNTLRLCYAWYPIRLFKILAYRGRRHAQALPARGQRTRSNSAFNAGRGQIQSFLTAIRLGTKQDFATSLVFTPGGVKSSVRGRSTAKSAVRAGGTKRGTGTKPKAAKKKPKVDV
jgi:hypothetical protein